MVPNRLRNFEDISSYQLCCGCGVCAYLFPASIKMVDVPFLGNRPEFSEAKNGSNVENVANVYDVCPGISLNRSHKRCGQEGEVSMFEKTWGPILEIWEAQAVEEEIRFKGSSGGAITAIALFCLEIEKMAGVLHTVADPKQPHRNMTVFSRERDLIINGAGSRYSPASPCEKLDEIESAAGKCVFVGKPCDVAAVQKIKRYRANLDKNIALTISCFCAGTPSTIGTLELLNRMGVKNVENLSRLRYRGDGWPGMTKAETVEGCHDSICELTYEQSWGDILQKHRQWRCYICPDHTGEFADLAVGDPWYREIEQGETGRSLILVRTEQGRKLLKSAIENGYISGKKRKPEVLIASQKNLAKTRARLWGQLFVLKMLGAPCPKYRGFYLFYNWAVGLSIREKVRSIIGTVKRVFVKKLRKRQNVF